MADSGSQSRVPYVRVKLFAWLRAFYGCKELYFSPEEIPSVGEVLRRLQDIRPNRHELLTETGSLRPGFIVLLNGQNLEFAGGLEATLAGGDEVSLFPPMAGG